MAWIIPVATAVYGAYAGKKSADESKKAQEDAAKAKETTSYRYPYMNEYIARIIPYLINQQQQVYQSRQKTYGFEGTSGYDQIAQMLAGISNQYSGNGMPGSPINMGGSYGSPWGQQQSTNPFMTGGQVSRGNNPFMESQAGGRLSGQKVNSGPRANWVRQSVLR